MQIIKEHSCVNMMKRVHAFWIIFGLTIMRRMMIKLVLTFIQVVVNTQYKLMARKQ